MQRLRRLRESLAWFLLFLALWWLLGAGAGWAFGVPAAALAAGVTYWLSVPFWRLRLRALPGFLWFFFTELTVAGLDVARRVVHPRLPVSPAWVRYPLRQNSPRVTLMLSAMVGLLPGTLATRAVAGHLEIHALNGDGNWQVAVARLESRLIRLLGAP